MRVVQDVDASEARLYEDKERICGGSLGENPKHAGAAAPTGVPRVVTGGPRRWAFEGVDQVEDSPGQHHDVVDVQVGHDHLRRHSDPCRERSHTYFRIQSFIFPENLH